MGSPYTVQIVEAELNASRVADLRARVESRLTELNRQMSHYQPDSELSRFNRSPANEPFLISPEFARVVGFALGMSRRSEGAFDPTLGPLINLWGFGERGTAQKAPAASALAEARGRVGWQHLRITDRNELIKDLPGLTVNLSAVAKGFAVDEVTRLLERQGLTNTYVSIAGEVFASGHNPGGTRWRVGISAPTDFWRENDPMASAAAISGQALSTSGDYQKFFRDPEGRRFSHILDPRTGRPVQHALAGVTVVAPDSMTADALGTTLFVLGSEAGLRFIDAQPEAAALFILREADGRFRQVRSAAWERLTGDPSDPR